MAIKFCGAHEIIFSWSNQNNHLKKKCNQNWSWYQESETDTVSVILTIHMMSKNGDEL